MCERRKEGVELADAAESCNRCARCRFRVVGEPVGEATRARSEAGESPEIGVACRERELRAVERLSA